MRHVEVRQRGQGGVGGGEDQGGAREECGAQVPEGGVESGGGELEDAAVVVEGEAFDLGGDEARDAGVGDDDALGAAGRARGVDDVRRMLGQAADLRCRVGVIGCCNGLRGLDDAHGPRVVQHVRDPRLRVLRVDGDVGRARLQDAEDGDDQLDGPGQLQRHQVLGADALLDQLVREPVGAGVEFGVRDRCFATDDRGGVGAAAHLSPEQVREDGFRYLAGGVAVVQEGEAFPRVEDVERADAAAGAGGGSGQQPSPAVEEGAYGVLVEEVGAVLQDRFEAVGGAVGAAVFGDGDREVEAGGAVADGDRGGVQTGEGEVALGGVLESQQDLEQGVVGEGANRVEGLHQVLERHVLVVVGRQRALPDAAEEVGEGGVAGRVGAQDKGVDEEAHQVVQRLVRTARHRAPDRDVRARAEPREQSSETGLEHHEQARAVAAGQLVERAVEFGVHGRREEAASVGGARRAGAVGGEVELFGEARQRLAPVGGLSGEGARGVGLLAEEVALPEGVVGVLDVELGPVRRLAPAAGRVRRRQVSRQRPERPAVARDVVQEEEQDVFLWREGEQLGAQGDFGGQVESVARGAGQCLGEAGLVGVDDGQGGVGVRQDVLVGDAVHVREDRPQAFMTIRHIAEGEAECLAVEGAGQAQGERHGIGGARALHAVQEPQAALGERQRQDAGAELAGERGARRVRVAEAGSEGGRGGGLEEGTEFGFDAEGRADAGDQAGGEQGVAAEREEVVVRADLGDAEHLAEEVAQQLFACAARGSARRLGGRCGQGGAVELAVGGQRQGVPGEYGRGDHEVREPVAEMSEEGGRGYVRRDDVGHEAVVAHEHRRPGHAGVRGERGLDLAGFDAEAPYLDLLVGAAQELQLAVGATASEVAGAVHASAGRAVGVGDEAIRRQGRAVEVATCQAGAGQVQLTGDAGRDRAQGRVQDVGADLVDRAADGHGVRVVSGGQCVSGYYVRFRRAVVVVEPPVPEGVQPADPHGLAGLHDQPQVREVPALLLGGLRDRLQHQGRGVQLLDPVPLQPAHEPFGAAPFVVRGHDQRLAVQQRGQGLLDGDVEACGGELRDARAGLAAEGGVVPVQEVRERLGGHDDRLGASGRARRVDHVRRVLRRIRHLGGGVRVAGAGVDGGRVVEDEGRAGVGEHELAAGSGVFGGYGEVGGARLQYGEGRDDRFDASRQGDRDDVLRADPA
ncbi:hypothetical protein a10_08577 [Streptomyces acidiscabies]|nr:hypothetical protein a10_08577 [Streptomyces acidiscabies]GAV45533.1 hypothetical protein Saa2_08524 [Streptomyces acidiscabies]